MQNLLQRARAWLGPRVPTIYAEAEQMRAVLAARVDSGRLELVNTIGSPPESAVGDLHQRFLHMLNSAPTGHMLEVGSRARSGIVRRNLVPGGWQYTGMDVRDGPNVDVVGDAHKLSAMFPPSQFTATMAYSVLEHLLMPWKFAIELNRVLQVGAIGFFQTHQTWPVHETPWDFWRFSDEAWKAILNPGTGFEIIDARMSEPTLIVPLHVHPVTNFGDTQFGYLASAVLFRKVSDTSLEWPVELEQIVATSYPATQV